MRYHFKFTLQSLFLNGAPCSWTLTGCINLCDCCGKYPSIRIAFQKHLVTLYTPEDIKNKEI